MSMAAVASRPAVGSAVGFLRRSFNLVRALTTSSTASSPSSAAAAAEPNDKPKRKKKNLFEVAQFLPNWGIGYKVAKSHWRDVSYQITKINLYKDGRHGKAWGVRYKAGSPAAESPVKISGVHKRGWRYIPESKKKIKNTVVAEIKNVPVAAEGSLA